MMVLFCMMCRPPLATNELRSSTIGIASSLNKNWGDSCSRDSRNLKTGSWMNYSYVHMSVTQQDLHCWGRVHCVGVCRDF